jgi:hypothetical protein
MSSPTSVEQQLREWVGQLAPEHKHILLLMLAEDDRLLRAARLDFAEAQLRRLAKSRNADWDALDETAREALLDEVIREDEVYATQVGSASSNHHVSCYHCGHEMTPADLYRVYFGERSPKLEPASSARMVVLDVEGGNVQFPITPDGETLIGRLDPHRGIRPGVDLSKYDPASRVSRRHARITTRGSQFFIEDLGSANGTIINGRNRLKPQQPVALTNGDLVKIGETTLKFIA